MKYRQLGHWGVRLSVLGLGAWLTYGGRLRDMDLVKSIVRTAYEGGINFYDNADIYTRGQAEELMGEVLQDYPRHTLVMSSKVFWPMSDDINDRGLSRKHIRESIAKSLQRMRTDYLDIYFAHRDDPSVSMEEIVTSFSQLIDEGKILYWGTSEWSAARFAEAVKFARSAGLHPPAVEQPQYSMLYRERVEQEILPVTTPAGAGMVVWSPLAMGMLTGKYDDGIPDGSRFAKHDEFRTSLLTDINRQRVRELKSLADDLGITRSQLALAWILRQPSITGAIIGATRPEHVTASLGAETVELTAQVLARIDAILTESH